MKRLLFFIVLVLSCLSVFAQDQQFWDYKAKAERGDALAQAWVAKAYFEGIWNVTKNGQLAYYWAAESDAQNNDWGSYFLACCYSNGIWVAQDYNKAYSLFFKSFRNSGGKNSGAAFDLGCCYLYARGVTADNEQAFYYFKKAYELNPGYIDWYASCYEYGYGTDKDIPYALSLYRKSNSEFARQRIRELENDNPVEQLATISFSSPTISSTTSYNLRAGIKSSCKITNVSVSVNNARGIDVVVNDGNDFTLNKNLQLNTGSNTITVSVTNCAGTATKSFVVNVQGNPPQPVPDKRVAIVIGNSNYPQAPLTNPVNDATDMAAKLRLLGFDVTLQTNLSHSGFDNSLKSFKSKANYCDVALLYYAGHGMEIDGNNYLIPVDAPINDIDQLKYKSVDAYYALDILSGAKKKIIILDACRNNPSTRGALHGGLAAMNATNALIAYSTSPGKTAADGSGRNSPYTYALLNALNNKNLTLPQLFQMVAKNVSAQKTGQIPWYVSSLVEDVILNR